MSRKQWLVALSLGAWVTLPAPATHANVITDWDEKAVTFVLPSPIGQRVMAMVHVAMFDAVNSIEPRYRPYLVQLPTRPDASKEAAAASAAAGILAGVPGPDPGKVKAALSEYLATLPDGAGKAEGIRLGEAVAAKLLAARADDGAAAPDAYRPETKPGVYVPTAPVVAPHWPNLRPFAIGSLSQFRPRPPVSLKSKEWAAAYNEIKDYGGKTSARRSASQTDTARFWLIGGPPAYQPFGREIVRATNMSVVDAARFMALYTVALSDAFIAVLDAKYRYKLWRPVTAIRNGDLDDNPATARDPTWQPLDATPMHPEYPCGHCIAASTGAAVVESVLGTTQIPEVAVTSTTLPGATHRWTSTRAYADEVSEARVWAGFHYRFSVEVGKDMGEKIGRHVVGSVMGPVK